MSEPTITPVRAGEETRQEEVSAYQYLQEWADQGPPSAMRAIILAILDIHERLKALEGKA